MRLSKRTKEEALASFRVTAKRLSDPAEQERIEAEFRRQIHADLEEYELLLARSSVLGQDEILR